MLSVGTERTRWSAAISELLTEFGHFYFGFKVFVWKNATTGLPPLIWDADSDWLYSMVQWKSEFIESDKSFLQSMYSSVSGLEP